MSMWKTIPTLFGDLAARPDAADVPYGTGWVDEDDNLSISDGTVWTDVAGGGGAGGGFVVEAGHVENGSVLWRWGLNTYGQPYFDSAGVDAGEEQVLMVEDGLFFVEGAPL